MRVSTYPTTNHQPRHLHMTAKPAAEKHAFQTEVQQLLHLIIHSLYSDKDIFLRELVSNASDACDKLRFLALTDKDLYEDDEELSIWIELDKKAKTITVRDNGIGMDRDEVIANIGTIARSGTRVFLEQMGQKNADDSSFIGQFGVGFYSAFLVAQEVTLLTRKAGSAPADGVKWSSDGSGEYTLEAIDRTQRGTEIILKLQPDQKEYLEAYRLRGIIGKYSNHISLPIRMLEEQVKDQVQDQDQDQDEDQDQDQDQDQEQDQEQANQEKIMQWATVNKGTALWARPKNEISEEEYNSFYTSIAYDSNPPLVTLHNRVEGKMEYTSLFYIPGKAPFDLWDRGAKHGIKLYVRRIFIADDTKQLMPNYLRFVRGLVDSADLPLNVSREFLQQNKDIDKIRAASVKKILAELKNIASKDADKYAQLWAEYGRALKEGVIEEKDNKDTIVKLLRFASTHTEMADTTQPTQSVSLDDYLKRMPLKQKAIYYITADSYAAAKSSPHIEVFRKNDIEVLLLSDPVDEWVVDQLKEYEEKPLKSIAKGDLDIAELTGEKTTEATDESDADERKKIWQPLVDKIKLVLQDQVKDVRLSNRLVDSPACLVADNHDLGGNMERILKAIGQDAPTAKPILEINPDHPVVKQIDAAGKLAEDWGHVLFAQAVLAEGISLQDPGDYVRRINKLLVQ